MTQNSRFPGESIVHFGTILGPYLVSFFDSFFGLQFWSNSVTFWCQKGPKRSSRGSFLGSFFVIFGIPCQSENWALACTGAQFLRSQGVSFALFCDTFWKGCVKTLTGSFPQPFFKDLGQFGEPFGAHFGVIFGSFFQVFFLLIFRCPGETNDYVFWLPRGAQRAT